MRNIEYLGIKLEANLYECKGMIDDLDLIRHEMLVAANLADMTVVENKFCELLWAKAHSVLIDELI